jgi:integrase
VRATFDLNGCHPLLCAISGGGGRLTEAYIRRLMPRLAKKVGIPKRVHAHGLRHTHAAELRSEGIDIGIISKQLGHRSIATTARYLDHIAPYAVVEAMSGREWP